MSLLLYPYFICYPIYFRSYQSTLTMANILTQRTHKNPPFIKQKHSNSIQNHNQNNRNIHQDTILEKQNKKNPKIKNVLPILQQTKTDQLKENTTKKSLSIMKAPSILVQPNNQPSNPSPFNNLSNFRPLHLDPIDLNTQKTLVLEQDSHRKQSPPSNSKMSKKQRQICQNLYQEKLSNFTQNKKKSISHRIHVTSSKQKENNFKKINQDKASLYIGAKLNKNSHMEPKLLQKFENLGIEDNKLQSLIASRQKSSHSFMIRKKIPSSSLQNHRPDQRFSHLPNYRKDRFVRQEKVQENTEIKSQKQSSMLQKIQSQKLQPFQEPKKPQQKVENQYYTVPKKVTSKAKSGKVRKTRYSKVQQLSNVIFAIQNIVSPPSEKSNFRSIISDNLDIKKIHPIEIKFNLPGKSQHKKQECSFIDQCKQSDESIDEKNCQKIEEGFLNEVRSRQIFIKQGQNYNSQRPSEDRHLTNSQLKASRKRVSSIRALKNCYKNFHTEEQSDFLTDSKVAESTKRKQKQLVCLTHKINWGGCSKKKSTSEKGIEITNNLKSEVRMDEKMSENNIANGKVLKDEHNVEQQIQKQVKNKVKSNKKLRFSSDLQEIDIDGPFRNGILRVVSRKESGASIEKQRNAGDLAVSIQSRSLIVFDDPGISIIIKKDSSVQSSELQMGFNPTEQNLQDSQLLQQQPTPREGQTRRHNKRSSIKLQSLRELFMELKSHRSIQVPDDEDKQEQFRNKLSIVENQEMQ